MRLDWPVLTANMVWGGWPYQEGYRAVLKEANGRAAELMQARVAAEHSRQGSKSTSLPSESGDGERLYTGPCRMETRADEPIDALSGG